MKFKTWAVLVISALTIAGCNNKGTSYNESTNSPPTDMTQKGPSYDKVKTTTEQSPSGTNVNYQPEEQKIEVQDRLIVRNGTMNIEIESYDESERKVTELVKSLNGYVISTNSTANTSGKKQGTIAIKVPSDKYDELLSKMPAYGKVMSQNISSTDVTEEYIDLEARMKTQRELETRLLQMLNEKTGNLTDVLQVETKLAEVRQKIESTEGRMNFLKKQAAYSTLSLSLFEPSLLVTSSGGGFFYEIGEAIKKGLEGFTDVLTGLITVAIALIPLWAVVIAMVFILRAYLRKRKKKLAVTTPQ